MNLSRGQWLTTWDVFGTKNGEPRMWAGQAWGWGRLWNTCCFCSLPQWKQSLEFKRPRWIKSPPVSPLQAHRYQMLTVLTQSQSSDYWSSKREQGNLGWTLGKSVSSPIWLIIVLILAFLFKRPNLLRTLLNEHVKSFQIEDKPVRMYVHFNLWEIILWSRVPSAIMPLLTSVVSQPPPSKQYFATYFLRSWSVRPTPFCTYLFTRLRCRLWEYGVQ